MDVQQEAIVVVLSAGERIIERARRLIADRASVTFWSLSDPEELLLLLVASSLETDERETRQIIGVMLDVTTPTDENLQEQARGDSDEVAFASASAIARYISDLLARCGNGCMVQTVVVIADKPLVGRLQQMQIARCSFIAAGADDGVWRRMFDRLCRRPTAAPGRPAQRKRVSAVPSANAVPLRDDLYFEPATCELLRKGRHIPLTARESALLATLLRSPNVYLSTVELARRLTRPDAPYPVEEHSIEQTISALRRKLGEPPHHPRLLLSRRGIGYGNFPQVRQTSQVPSLPNARMEAVEISHRRR